MSLPSLAAIATAPRRQMAWATNNGVGMSPLTALWGVTFNGPWQDASGLIPFDSTVDPAGVSPTSYQYRGSGSSPYETYRALDLDMVIANIHHMGAMADGSRVGICDLLWISPTYASSSPQAVSAFTLPARDVNDATDGEGCVAVVFTEGTPTYTLSYTNSDGVAGRSSTLVIGGGGGPHIFPLEPGDTGVRSIQTVDSSATSEYRVAIIRRLATYQERGFTNVLQGVSAEARTVRGSVLARARAGALLFPVYGFNGGARVTNTVIDLAVV